MQQDFADLELALHKRDAFTYSVDLRFKSAQGSTDDRQEGEAAIDLQRLRQLALDDEEYGKTLTESLFADPAIRDRFVKVCGAAQAQDHVVRLRLFISRSAAELHGLRWERLLHPQDGSPLLTSEHFLFSRYLTSQDWRPIQLRPQGSLRVLLVVANPKSLADYGLPPVDLDEDLAGIDEAEQANQLKLKLTRLASPGEATLDKMIDELRHGYDELRQGYDVLYLVCHGALDRERRRALLWLEGPGGEVDRVEGWQLVRRLQELRERPRLVVLGSCDSAGAVAEAGCADEVLAALGPRMAEAGIPAVLAMNGRISTDSARQFLPRFFLELQKDGRVDRAMAVARGAIRRHSDWWVPVLFLRLRSGRIWYSRGLSQQNGGLDQWRALIGYIKEGRCTPILGPGVTEPILGSHRDIDRCLAVDNDLPLSPRDQENLPLVNQYLAVHTGRDFPRAQVTAHLRRAIRDRHRPVLEEYLRSKMAKESFLLDGRPLEERVERELRSMSLDEQITAIGGKRMKDDPGDPHRVLASLRLPLYVTADAHNLMDLALKAVGRRPQVETYQWKGDDGAGGSREADEESEKWPPSIFDRHPQWKPTDEEPLVYHLFGRFSRSETLVLSEDDYFDYLIGLHRHGRRFPTAVSSAFNNTALLFLGFHMDDWSFRVLFRIIQQEKGLRDKYSHVAAQIDPEGGDIAEPERARECLQSYFRSAHVSIYWGTAQDFIRDLKDRIDMDRTLCEVRYAV